VDWRNTVAEASETNNVRLGEMLNILAGIDLELTQVTAPATAQTFSPIPVTNTVRNTSTGVAGAFSVGIYFSSDPIITTNDLRIGGRTVSNLLAGQSSTATTTANINSNVPPGSYYIGAIADDTFSISELVETNNVLRGNVVQIVNGPDLIVTSVTGPTRGPTGTFISITNVIQNIGGLPVSAPFVIRNLLSRDPIVSSNDVFLGDIAITNSIGAGQSFTVTGLYFMSLSGFAATNYFLGAIADAQQQIAEVVETNNALVGSQIAIAFGPDLTVTTLRVPASAAIGNSMSVTSTVANIGEGIALYVDVGFYFSTNPVATTAGLLLGTYSFNDIFAGGTKTATVALPLPTTLTAGTYYLSAMVDYSGGIAESNEQNNALPSSAIGITVETDLEVSFIGTAGTIGTLVSVPVTNTVRNIGTGGSASFTVGIYVSTDPVITTNDLKVGTRAVVSLAAGTTDSAITTVQIPANVSSGNYYIGAIVDESRVIAESREDNNTASSLVSVVSGPDLVVSAVGSPSLLVAGESLFVTNTVRNAGLVDIDSAFEVGIYVSADPLISVGDLRIGSRTVAGLPAGQSSTAVMSINNLSIIPDTYYIGAIADYANNIPEVNEGNNSLAGNVITIRPVVISEVHVQGLELVVSFPSAIGRTYRLEANASLNGLTVWQSVTNAAAIPGTGGIVSARHVGALSQPVSFYRVRLLE
jgi:subtilase family serine protease